MNSAILALDIGSSGVKSTLVVRNPDDSVEYHPLHKIDEEIVSHQSDTMRVWAPKVLICKVTRAIHREIFRAKRINAFIEAIALTSTSSSMLLVDRQRILENPRPMRWDDTQSTQEAMELEALRKKTGVMPWMRPIPADSGIAKALFLMKHFKEPLSQPSVRVLEQWSFLNWWLTGKHVQAESILSRKWGLLDGKAWSPPFSEEFEQLLGQYVPHAKNGMHWFQEKFLPGPVVAAGETIGHVSQRLIQYLDFGVGNRPKVVAAPYDTAAQILGLGAPTESFSSAVSFGSSLGVCKISEYDSAVPFGTLGPYPRIPCHRDMMLFDGIASCGSSLDYICKLYHILKDDKPDFEQINKFLINTPIGSEGVTVLPFFKGGRRTATNIPSDGSFEGLKLSVNQGHVVRAFFEAICYVIKNILADFERVSSSRIKVLLVGGAAVQSRPFMQMLADVTNRSVNVSKYPNSALLGASICAASGLNWHKDLRIAASEFARERDVIVPQHDATSQYQELYEAFLKKYAGRLELRNSR